MDIGYFGIVLLMVVSPIPPELFIPLAGFMVAEGKLNAIGVVSAGVIGFLLSSMPWYFIGRSLGEEKLKQFMQRHRRWIVFSPDKLEQATDWFYHRRKQAVFLSFLLPGTRNLISIPAGISGMSFGSYFAYSFIGATVWLGLLTAIGYGLGSRYYLVKEYVGPAYNIVIAVLVGAGLIFLVRRYIKRRK